MFKGGAEVQEGGQWLLKGGMSEVCVGFVRKIMNEIEAMTEKLSESGENAVETGVLRLRQ